MCQKAPSDLLEKLANFFVYIRQIRKKNQYSLSSIYAADKTAVSLDSISNTTVDHIGAKGVGIRSSGREKARITVKLIAKMDGTKLKLFVILD